MPRRDIPDDVMDVLDRQAAAAGYTSKRSDAPNSRWEYAKKLLALGRQYHDAISIRPRSSPSLRNS